jgi:diacylglycerol kinase family enzyme
LLASATIEIGQWIGFGRSHRYLVVTNGGLLDGRNIAPRAHPNDGFVDVMGLGASMSLRDRRKSRHRARTGAHIPHPSITISRGESFVFTREYKREKLVIDRHRIKSWNSLEIKVRPDYWQVIV